MRFQNDSDDTQSEATRRYNSAVDEMRAADWEKRVQWARALRGGTTEAEFQAAQHRLDAAVAACAELEVR